MDVLDLISAFRQRTGDYTSSDGTVVYGLQRADRIVFLKAGGSDNPDIAHALQENTSGFVLPDEDVIMLPTILSSHPRAILDGKVCHIISEWAGNTFTQHSPFKPAVSFTAREAKFYFDMPPTQFPEAESRVKALRFSLSYIRSPRRILYIPGNTAVLSNRSYCIRGKRNMKKISIVRPAAQSYLDERELVGGTVSLQTSDKFRTDYFVEHNEAGRWDKIYVRDEPNLVPSIDTRFIERGGEDNEYRAVIHRSSELPDKFHQEIVESAIKFVQYAREAKYMTPYEYIQHSSELSDLFRQNIAEIAGQFAQAMREAIERRLNELGIDSSEFSEAERKALIKKILDTVKRALPSFSD